MLKALLPALLSLLLSQPALAAPTQQISELKIVAVEQIGKPPYKPNEGRVYRLSGGDISRIKVGDILTLKRSGSMADIGLLRVISVNVGDSIIARQDVKGATFPIKGDAAYPMSPIGIPDIQISEVFSLKLGIPLPLNPLLLPAFPDINSGELPFLPLPLSTRTVEEIAASPNTARTKPRDSKISGLPKLVEQNPIYFLKDSAAVSPKGIEKIRSWTQDWGRRGLKYFLAVPQNQLHLEKKTVARLAALQTELERLGITNIEFRTDSKFSHEPFDVIFVGIEGN